ncbi:hypothetical protein UB46_05990 [Burkholderiaceae bacterium 16]|nr:hypothetical protein UB46_05990 [Burkholderiaceae bacterium 16]
MHGTPKLGGRGGLGLRGGNPVWSHANCNVDLWIELLHGWELESIAALAFTVSQDFEGDQFTLFSFPFGDLERLYGVTVHDLSVYDNLEGHIAAQTCRGNVVLLDVDSFNLPYAAAAGYRRQHARSCIGVDLLVPEASTAGYYHGDGYHTVSGEEYQAIFRLPAELKDKNIAPYPQARVVRRRFAPQTDAALVRISLDMLRRHLARRPRVNPISAFRTVFPAHLDQMMGRGEPGFQAYASSVLRQLGANFELLGCYLRWLVMHGQPLPDTIAEACYTIASEAMVMQFRLMRAVISRKPDPCQDCFDQLEMSYKATVPALAAYFGEVGG